MEEFGVVLTVVYFVLLVPIVMFYRAIYRGDHCSNCRNCNRCADPPPLYRSKPGAHHLPNRINFLLFYFTYILGSFGTYFVLLNCKALNSKITLPHSFF